MVIKLIALISIFETTFAISSDCFASGTYTSSEPESTVSNLQTLQDDDQFDVSMQIHAIVGCVNVINQITRIHFNLKSEIGQSLELEWLGPSINGQRCSTLILDDEETVTTFEVTYTSSSVLNSVAVITDKL